MRRIHPGHKAQSKRKPPTALRVVRLLSREGFVILIGILMGMPLGPIVAPRIYFDTPSLIVQAYLDPASFFRKNGTDIYGIKWDSRYVDYVVQFQVKAEQTSVEDVNAVIDFGISMAILKVEEDLIVGANPSFSFPRISIYQNAVPVKTQKPCQFFVFIGSLAHDGLCSYHVIIDPKYQGGTFRNIVIGPSGYQARFRYDAYGFRVMREVTGQIQSAPVRP